MEGASEGPCDADGVPDGDRDGSTDGVLLGSTDGEAEGAFDALGVSDG